jgi:L-rhamnose mutarotase
MRRHVLALDLKDDPALIAGYEAHHAAVWPEVEARIREAGVLSCAIYRAGARLVMVLEVVDGFSFEAKAAGDAAHEPTQRWEELMARYQQPLPVAAPGHKWTQMACVYELGSGGGGGGSCAADACVRWVTGL